MVTVTSKAVEKIKDILKSENKEGYGLRLAVVGGGCAGFQYYMDFEKEPSQDDIIFEQDDGIKVFVDKRLLTYLDGSTIDYEEGLQGAGFKIDNPNAQGGCGCGKSFSF
ncbi:MAG: HesB/IscA family protein [Planctomycetota bacterium]